MGSQAQARVTEGKVQMKEGWKPNKAHIGQVGGDVDGSNQRSFSQEAIVCSSHKTRGQC